MTDLDKRFIVNRQGKDFVLYAGLVDGAHSEGLKRITTVLLQAPNAENAQTAIVHAQVETNRGVFDGIGDASPQNVGRMIAMHAIRMAETRAKARALRDALNVTAAALEELEEEEETPAPARQQQPPAATDRAQRYTSALPDSPASRIQKDRMVKLLTSLGRPVDQALLDAMTAGQAEQQIAALARAFNEQARSGHVAPVEQRTTVYADDELEAVFPTSARR